MENSKEFLPNPDAVLSAEQGQVDPEDFKLADSTLICGAEGEGEEHEW